jgi:hypothetical protein
VDSLGTTPDQSDAETARLKRYEDSALQQEAANNRTSLNAFNRANDPYYNATSYDDWPDETSAETARLNRYAIKARFLADSQKRWDAQDAGAAKAFAKFQRAQADAYRKERADAAQQAKWDAMRVGAWAGRTNQATPIAPSNAVAAEGGGRRLSAADYIVGAAEIVGGGLRNQVVRIGAGLASIPYAVYDGVDAAVAVQNSMQDRFGYTLQSDGAKAIVGHLAPVVAAIQENVIQPTRAFSERHLGDGVTSVVGAGLQAGAEIYGTATGLQAAGRLFARALDTDALAMTRSGEVGNTGSLTVGETPPLLALSRQPGTVVRNALTDTEFAQAQDLATFRGGQFVGAPTENFPGIDGWLDGVPIQMKTVTGSGEQAILRNIVKGAGNMSAQGYVGDIAIDATQTGATVDSFANFVKPGTPVGRILNEGSVNNVYIKLGDGWLNITQGTLVVPGK